MRKWITFLMTAFVGTSISYAGANFGQVNFEAGYRNDNITFEEDFRDSGVGLKSRFKNLDIFQLGIQGRTTLGCNFYVRGSAYFGWILDGDFKEEAFTNSFYGSGYGGGFGYKSHNTNLVDDRYVYGIAAAIGYPFYFCDCSMALAPVVGYSFDQQNVRVDGPTTSLYRYEGSYRACVDDCCSRHIFTNRWYGPFVGVDFLYQPCGECWDLYADLEYHWATNSHKRGLQSNYEDGSHHDATSHNARAWVFEAGADYDFDHCWTLGFSVKFQDWRAHKNRHNRITDYGYSSGGDEKVRHSSKWRSYAINLTIGRDF